MSYFFIPKTRPSPIINIVVSISS